MASITRIAAVMCTLGIINVHGWGAHAGTVLVTPSAMGTWAFDNRDANGTIGANAGAVGAMVVGPATPPLGTGSANLQSGLGGGGSELRNSDYAGVSLSSITSLFYSSYATSNNGQQVPFLQLYVSTTGGTTYDDRLTFEPTYSSATQPAVATGDWQTWNALTGLWYDDTGFGNPGIDNAKTLAAFEAQFPLAKLVNPSGFSDGTNNNITLGGVRFTTGFADSTINFNGNVDAVTVGVNGSDTTYNFEAAAAVPEPATLGIFGSAIVGLGALRRRRAPKA